MIDGCAQVNELVAYDPRNLMQNHRPSTRRQWLKRAAWSVAAAGAGVVVDTFLIEPHWLEIVQRDLPIDNLPSRWKGRSLAQISDVHVGAQVSESFLIRAFEKASEYAPDVVVVTGDFVSFSRDGVLPAEQARRVYKHLPRGKRATLGIPGNHDYGPSWSDPKAAAKVQGIMSDCGLRMLRNQSIDLDGLEIVGLDELWAKRCDGRAAFATSDSGTARLALCHNPDAADRNIWEGYHGWILAGHTHGGQCKPPFLPPPLLPVRNRRYTSGEFQLNDGRKMYISRGLGHLLPVRFNCRPEITIFRLMP
jgi:predicted MPP superfamily phosphohydrolase